MAASCRVAGRCVAHGRCNVGVVSWKHAPPKRKRLLSDREPRHGGLVQSSWTLVLPMAAAMSGWSAGSTRRRNASVCSLRSRASAWRPSAKQLDRYVRPWPLQCRGGQLEARAAETQASAQTDREPRHGGLVQSSWSLCCPWPLQCRGGQLEARAARNASACSLRSRASAWRPCESKRFSRTHQRRRIFRIIAVCAHLLQNRPSNLNLQRPSSQPLHKRSKCACERLSHHSLRAASACATSFTT